FTLWALALRSTSSTNSAASRAGVPPSEVASAAASSVAAADASASSGGGDSADCAQPAAVRHSVRTANEALANRGRSMATAFPANIEERPALRSSAELEISQL